MSDVDMMDCYDHDVRGARHEGYAAGVAAERKRMVDRFTQERAILMRDGFPVGVHYIDRAIQQIKEAQP